MRQHKKKNSAGDMDLLSIDQYSLVPESQNVQEPVTGPDVDHHESKNEEGALHRVESGVSDAKEHLNRLILQDLGVTPMLPKVLSQNATYSLNSKQVTKRKKTPLKTQSTSSKEVEKPSQYILDLRKHYLIEKYKLNSLEQPRQRLSVKLRGLVENLKPRERIEWHYPEQIKKKPFSTHAFFPYRREQNLPVLNRPQSATVTDERTSDESESVVEEVFEEIEEVIPWKMRVYAVGTFWAVLIFVLIPIPVITYATRVSSDGQSVLQKGLLAFSSLKAGVADLTNSDYANAQGSLTEAQKNFNEITTKLDSYSKTLSAIVQFVPSVRSKVTLAKTVGVVGDHTAAIGLILSSTLSTDTNGPTVTDHLIELRSHVRAIADALETSVHDLKLIDPNEVPLEWRDQFEYIQQHTDDFIKSLRRADNTLDVASHILGAESLTRYLIIFQNTRELRPTGGFMGSFALVDFLKGRPLSIDFPGGGTYDLEGGFKQHLLPPRPISILNQEWHIWDSNWWPDFPTSAEKIAWFYQQSGGRTVDGVIAVNSDFVVDILRAVGPIEMPEYGITVDADSFYTIMQNEIELQYDKSLNQPKKILKDLFPLLIDRLFKSANYKQLLAITTQSLAQKDIQVAILNDQETQRSVEHLSWDGSMSSNAKDYLSVISTNIAGGKSDASIFQTIDHQAIVDDGGTITVTTSVTKEHRADPADQFAYVNNVDYIRFYVPLGSTLVRATGFQQPPEDLFHAKSALQVPDSDLESISGVQVMDQTTGTTISQELNHTVFGNWVQVQPGGRTAVSITYTLPFKITIPKTQGVDWLSLWGKRAQEVDAYSLLVQRQSGKKNTIFNSSVVFPDEYSIVWSDSVDPAHSGVAPHTFTYSNELGYDTYYALLVARKANE